MEDTCKLLLDSMVSQLVQQDGVVSIWWQILEVMADFTYGQPWTPGHRLQLLLKSQLHKCFKSQRRCRKSRFRWSESNMKPHETTIQNVETGECWMSNIFSFGFFSLFCYLNVETFAIFLFHFSVLHLHCRTGNVLFAWIGTFLLACVLVAT